MRHHIPDAGSSGRQRVFLARFQPQTLQQVLRHLKPVGGRRAHVGQRLEVAGERLARRVHAGLRPRLANQRSLGLCRALNRCCHAAESQPQLADGSAVERDGETAAQRGDVGIETLADLVSPHLTPKSGQRHREPLDELACFHPVLHVAGIEISQRHAAHAGALAQLDERVERHQHRRAIPDRRAVGDVAAERAGMADRRRREAQPHVGQRRCARHQRQPCGFEQTGVGFVQGLVHVRRLG